MNKRTSLLILALFSMAAYGLSTVMFNDLSYEMAASIGFSIDEMSQVKVGFTIFQVLGLLLTPLLIRLWGTSRALLISLLVGLFANLALAMAPSNELIFIIAWLASGFMLSVLLAVVNLLVLNDFAARVLPVIIALMLIFTTLLPLGGYPWLTAELLESFSWSLFSMVLTWLFFAALVISCVFPPKPLQIELQPKSSLVVYLFIASAISLIVFLLMRGDYYNWLDSVLYSELTVIAVILSLSAIYLLVRTRGKRRSAAMQLHSQLKINVFMYNAFLAGFAVSGSTILFSNFLGKVLNYNSLNAGYAYLPSFYAMLAGMILSVLVFCYRRPLSDAVVPFGVVMILLSVYTFSQLPSNVDPESLLRPMLLRGFGIGLLNVSVTISVLMHFKVDQRIEGICNFYLFRTMGSLIGGAFFSRVIQNQSAQAAGEIGRTLDAASRGFRFYQQALGDAILTQGHLSTFPIEMGQITNRVTEQATTLALNNTLIVFILSIFALAPILLIGKKLAEKQSTT
ncbi:MAG: DHA2 family multidrug resistance protein [Psychromonas sp.]|jgi:DHA2 family multidrug resistance protein|uniref:MFS transporter n=1 Tax=Psychromonas sp. TaxID=1884585 RepID=UPI0039E30E3F